MKFTNKKQFADFEKAIDKCQDNVFLKSVYGDCYNLKSKLSQYTAFAALLGNHGDELELFCDNREDEIIMMEFLKKHDELH